jgi:hypothetical protein
MCDVIVFLSFTFVVKILQVTRGCWWRWKSIAYYRLCRDGIYFDKILVSENKLFKRLNKANLYRWRWFTIDVPPSSLNLVLLWHIVVDHLQRRTVCHVWLGVYRCLLIAHLLCEYLIVAKLGVPEKKKHNYFVICLKLLNWNCNVWLNKYKNRYM